MLFALLLKTFCTIHSHPNFPSAYLEEHISDVPDTASALCGWLKAQGTQSGTGTKQHLPSLPLLLSLPCTASGTCSSSRED